MVCACAHTEKRTFSVDHLQGRQEQRGNHCGGELGRLFEMDVYFERTYELVYVTDAKESFLQN